MDANSITTNVQGLNWVIANWESLVLIITSLVTVASIIVKLTPTPKDDEFLGKILKIISLIALNKKG